MSVPCVFFDRDMSSLSHDKHWFNVELNDLWKEKEGNAIKQQHDLILKEQYK